MSARSRAGLSLLEVVLAFVILATSMVAIGQLMILGARQSTTVIEQAKGQQYALSVLDAVAAGAVPLQSTTGTPFEKDKNWQYSLDVQPNDFIQLKNVTVTVEVVDLTTGGAAGGVAGPVNPSAVTLTRWILDPQEVAQQVGAAYRTDLDIIDAMIDAEAAAEADAGGGR